MDGQVERWMAKKRDGWPSREMDGQVERWVAK